MSSISEIIEHLTEGEDFSVKELEADTPVNFKLDRIKRGGIEMIYVYAAEPGAFQENIGVINAEADGFTVAYTRNHGILRRANREENIVFPTEQEAINAILMDWTGQKPLIESDDFSVKDVTHDPAPKFELRARDENDFSNFDVFVEGKWIGRVGKVRDWIHAGGRVWPDPEGNKWQPNWMPDVEAHPRPDTFNSAYEAAQWLWDHRQYQSMLKFDEAAEDVKDAALPTFEFRLRPRGRAGIYYETYDIFVGDRYLGTTSIDDAHRRWLIGWVPALEGLPRPESFSSKEEAAEWLWMQRSMRDTHPRVESLVNEIIDDDSEPNQFLPGPALKAANELREAGFTVTKAEEHEKGWLLECSWLAPSNKTFIAGAQRIKEVVGKHLPESLTSTRRNGQTMEIRLWHTSQKEN